MGAVEYARFDRSSLDHYLDVFEQSGPALPDGIEAFCDALETWIAEGAGGDESPDWFRADLSYIKGMIENARGSYENAIDHFHDSMEASRTSGNGRRHIFGLCAIALCFEYAGMQVQASSSIVEALDLAEGLGNELVHATVLHSLTSLYQSQGAYEQMLESALRTVSLAEALDDRKLMLRTYSAVGLALAFLDRGGEGVGWCEKGLALVDAETPSFVKTYLNLNVMFLHQRSGRPEEAVRLAEKYVDGIAELPAQHAAVLYVDIAEIHISAGNLDRAGEMLAHADRVSDPDWMKAHLLGYYNVAAELHEAQGEPAKALEMLRRYMQLEGDLRGRQAQTRLVAIERYFAAELVAKTEEVHYLRTVELAQKNTQLSNLIRQNDEILHVVVNDLRNPLAATRLLSEVLLNEMSHRVDDDAVKIVQSMRAATVDMSDAIERLVDEVRPE